MIPRSFAWRTALASAAVMLAASLLGGAWTLARAERALREQLDLALAAEAEALVGEFNAYGLAGLSEQAASYARRRGPVLVLLQSADGRAIAGRLPTRSTPFLRGFATLERQADGVRLRALGVFLPVGANLIVAAELTGVERSAARLAWAPAIVAGLASVLALALGFFAARGLERRLQEATRAARVIMDGDLSRRLPQGGPGDEFDRLAATMNLLLARIEALVLAQRQVTDDIAHDLRTPLSRLRQRLESAVAAERSGDADGATLEEALLELDQVLATFASLLRIARAESGSGRDQFRRVDLSELMRRVVEAFQPVAEEAGRDLRAELDPDLVCAGDEELLRQAVLNLVHNALLHGGDRIVLRLRPGPRIEVEDDGPGIPKDEREVVTRRFHRLEASRGKPGTGLGLALVAATARLHGGALRIEEGDGGRGVRAVLDLAGGDGGSEPARFGF